MNLACAYGFCQDYPNKGCPKWWRSLFFGKSIMLENLNFGKNRPGSGKEFNRKINNYPYAKVS